MSSAVHGAILNESATLEGVDVTHELALDLGHCLGRIGDQQASGDIGDVPKLRNSEPLNH